MIRSLEDFMGYNVYNIANKEIESTGNEIFAQAVHSKCLKDYFIRLSLEHKVAFLTVLMKQLKSFHSAAIILNTLFSVNCKLASYTKIQTDSNFLYDKCLEDHDRMLTGSSIETVVRKDINWFQTLDEPTQISLLMGLLRLGGGCVIKRVYWRFIAIYNSKIASAVESQEFEKYISEPSWFYTMYSNNPVENTVKTIVEPKERDTSNDPVPSQAVLDGRKYWNVLMDRWKEDIESQIKSHTDKYYPKFIAVSASATSKSKKDKPSKKDKKPPRPKAMGADAATVDWVQLLPITVVKQIFSYIDERTLKKYKTVSKYWAEVITDVSKDVKTRKKLNQIIFKAEVTINAAFSKAIPYEEVATVKAETPLPTPKPLGPTELREKKLQRRGAILEKLVWDYELQEKYDDSLWLDVMEQTDPAGIAMIENLKPFPRNVPDPEHNPLYQEISCALRDLDLIIQTQTTEESDDEGAQSSTKFTLPDSNLSTIASNESGTSIGTTKSMTFDSSSMDIIGW